jgi:hypothetical protein
MTIKRQELDLPFDQYRNMTDYISISELKSFDQSPFSYWSRYIAMNPETNKKSAAMIFGSLCHCLVLEPSKFDKEYLVSDVRKDVRTNAYKEVLQTAANRSVISEAEYDRAKKVADSALETMKNEGLTDLVPEVSYFYEGKGFPTKVKARFDGWLPKHEAVFDLKTTNSLPTYDDVIRIILNFKYHWQVAFYFDIHKAVTGRQPKDFFFCFSLTEFPFASVIYKVGHDFISAGRDEYKKSLKTLSEALQYKQINNFPRIVKQKKVLELPHWYKNKAKYEVKDL